MPTASSITQDTTTNRLDAAATVGLISNRIPLHICTGSVVVAPLVRKRASTSSLKEVRNAKAAPAAMPGQMIGSVT